MAKLYGEIAAKALLTLDKSFARANGQPLDASEVYYSLQAAKDYAATAQAYIGQKIVVVEDNVVTHYSVEDTAGNLKELGSKPVGDEKSITVAEDGTVSLAGIGTLVFEREVDVIGEDGQPTGEKTTEEVKYQPLMTKAGLVWVEPSKTTVEGLATLIDNLTQRVSALETKVGNAAKPESSEGANDGEAATGLYAELDKKADKATTYTKDEVDSAIDDAVKGILGEGVDEAYNTLKEIEDILKGTDGEAIDGVIEGIAANKDAIETLNGDTTVEGSVDKKIADAIGTPGVPASGEEGAEDYVPAVPGTGVYANAYSKSETDAQIAAAVKNATGGTDASSVAADLNAYKTSNNTRVGNVEARVKTLEDVGAQANVIEGVQVNGADLLITDKKVNIDLSTYASTTAVQAAQKAADDAKTAANEAKAAASTNAGEIEGIKTNYVTNTALNNTLANYLNATQIADTYLDKTTAGQTYLNKTEAANTYLDKVTAGSTYATKASVEELSGTVTNLTETVNSKANASEVYTKTEIDAKTGTIPEGSSIMAEIAKAQSAATYDDTAVKASIEAIYKAGEGENAATGVLANEIARAKEAEAANAKSIADLTAAIDNVSNIMNFRGVVEATDAGFEEDIKVITEPKDGDVILYKEQEYVYNKGVWVLFGDASGNAAAITALTVRVEANETAVQTTLPGAIAQTLTDAKAYTDQQITALGMANYTVKSVVSGHEALTVNNVDGVVTIGFADEIVLNGGSAN